MQDCHAKSRTGSEDAACVACDCRAKEDALERRHQRVWIGDKGADGLGASVKVDGLNDRLEKKLPLFSIVFNRCKT